MRDGTNQQPTRWSAAPNRSFFGGLPLPGNPQTFLLRQYPYLTQQPGGRIRAHKRWWFKLRPPLQIVEVLTKGLTLHWNMKGPPPLGRTDRTYKLQPPETEGLERAMEEYRQLGAVEKFKPRPQDQWYSHPVFGREKHGGQKWRMISDLTGLNAHLHNNHFRMEQLKTAADLLNPHEWMSKIDISGAYHHIPLNTQHKKFFVFKWGQSRWVWKVMPFGLSLAPRLWTKLFRVVLHKLRAMGIRIVAYVDDLIIISPTREQARRDLHATLRLLVILGFQVAWEKCTLEPQQRLEFVGFVLDSQTMTIQAEPNKKKDLQAEARQTLRSLNTTTEQTTARALSVLIGKMSAMRPAVELAHLHTVCLNKAKDQAVRQGQWEHAVTPTPGALQELEWWAGKQSTWWTPIPPHLPPQHIMTTDASALGWGGTLHRPGSTTFTHIARQQWSVADTHSQRSINAGELEAGLRCLQTWENLHDTRIEWHTDNSSVVYSVTKWKTGSADLAARLVRLWELVRERNITLHPVHIPGDTNVVADRLSRWLDRNDHQLNPVFFREIQKVRQQAKIDTFASSRNHLLPRFWTLVDEPGSSGTDFFRQTLKPETHLWANPPFKLVGRVLQKLTAEGASATMVVPKWETAPWWPTLMCMQTAPPILVPRHQDTFLPATTLNLCGVGPPPWDVWACEVSGDPEKVREAQEKWGHALHTLDMTLLHRLPRIMWKVCRRRHEAEEVMPRWARDGQEMVRHTEAPW